MTSLGGASFSNASAPCDLKLAGVRRTFGDIVAVDNVSFEAAKGEFISFLGPSGCGKTTTLSMIAGFLETTEGAIEIRGRRVEGLPPEKRNTGMVFQNYALFPHMSVAENVGFGLRMRGIAAAEARSKVAAALQMVRMESFADRKPSQMSGGQQQRVALARALVIQPDLLLLDEPFGALDRQLREGMQFELKALQKSVGITTVFVTHDQEEALSMSDRIVVMNNGVLEQIGTPMDIYEYPATTFVARFVGKSNLIPGTVVMANADRTVVDTQIGRLNLPPLMSGGVVGDVECLVRPEKLTIAAPGSAQTGRCRAQGTVQQAVYHGAVSELHLDIGGAPISLAISTTQDGARNSPLANGDSVEIAWAPEDMRLFKSGMLCR